MAMDEVVHVVHVFIFRDLWQLINVNDYEKRIPYEY
jgi:hypothetical protein